MLGLQRRLTACDAVALPDPVKVSTTDGFAALLAREILPEAAPVLCGLKVSVSNTLCPAASDWGRDIPLRLNSALVEVAEDMVTLDAVAVSVAVRLLLAPTGTLPKFKALVFDVRIPAETPLADRAIVKDGVAAFETTSIVPVMLPAASGVQRTLKVTLCPLARVTGRAKPLTPNPGWVTLAWEMVTVEVPEFVKLSNRVKLLPS